ncbi:hemerythrin domain-containing protein [Nakamurella endophytica]|uniref:Hemerythrin-like domain-containing protein n=1 Tax=Nakamurella endophytica TaxID=1748367 RepID=A0A917SP67_9ACTN|nr:hemerythrin domain-containing protein [Nakamurella endophytica]GGL90669.1 hypothetical protein GCM10011594_07870 [Nakamurella endophytica]
MTTTPTPRLPFPVTPRRPGEPEADLMGFTLIHRALRSGTRLLAVAVTSVADGAPCDDARRAAIGTFADHVLTELHQHHTKEDDVLWPVIAVSAGPHVDLDPLTDDHAELHQLLEQATSALAGFRAAPAADLRTAAAALGRILTTVADELDEHIEDEEATVFPVIRTYVSHADFAHCERKFRKDAKLGHLIFTLPWVVEQCTEQELAALRSDVPLPLRLLLRAVQPSWRRRRDLVAGTAGR